jgi:hypothetical protein
MGGKGLNRDLFDLGDWDDALHELLSDGYSN